MKIRIEGSETGERVLEPSDGAIIIRQDSGSELHPPIEHQNDDGSPTDGAILMALLAIFLIQHEHPKCRQATDLLWDVLEEDDRGWKRGLH
jgi:hypothetical protein